MVKETQLAILPKYIGQDFTSNWKPQLKMDEYHAQREFMGASGLKEINRSPLHFYHRYALGNDQEATPAQKIGALVHAAILEPDRFRNNMKVSPSFDRRTKIGKAQHEDWLARREPNDIVIDQDDYDLIQRIIEQVYAHPVARGVLLGGEREWSGFFRDASGLACKIRPDLMVRDEGMILDVKTTTDARKGACIQQIAKYRYDLSAAFYLHGAAQIDQGIKWSQYFFLFVEKTKPFASSLFLLDNAGLETGEIAMKKAIATYGSCVKAQKWLGYQEAAEYISVPDWLFKETEPDMDVQAAEEESASENQA